jgi:hypothetical protein
VVSSKGPQLNPSGQKETSGSQPSPWLPTDVIGTPPLLTRPAHCARCGVSFAYAEGYWNHPCR